MGRWEARAAAAKEAVRAAREEVTSGIMPVAANTVKAVRAVKEVERARAAKEVVHTSKPLANL